MTKGSPSGMTEARGPFICKNHVLHVVGHACNTTILNRTAYWNIGRMDIFGDDSDEEVLDTNYLEILTNQLIIDIVATKKDYITLFHQLKKFNVRCSVDCCNNDLYEILTNKLKSNSIDFNNEKLVDIAVKFIQVDDEATSCLMEKLYHKSDDLLVPNGVYYHVIEANITNENTSSNNILDAWCADVNSKLKFEKNSCHDVSVDTSNFIPLTDKWNACRSDYQNCNPKMIQLCHCVNDRKCYYIGKLRRNFVDINTYPLLYPYCFPYDSVGIPQDKNDAPLEDVIHPLTRLFTDGMKQLYLQSVVGVDTVRGVALHKNNIKSLVTEYNLLLECTVPLTTYEIYTEFSSATVVKASRACELYGLCVLKGVYDVDTVCAVGEAARGDFQEAVGLLKEDCGVDLLSSSTHTCTKKQGVMQNYQELSMRERKRVDLRDGPRVRAVDARQKKGELNASERLINHKGIDRALHRCMYPQASTKPIEGTTSIFVASGNWGRWNFEASGPSALNGTSEHNPPPISYSDVGCVCTIPGCVDQTIHADTPHLYDHVQLPVHYLHTFIPSARTNDILRDRR